VYLKMSALVSIVATDKDALMKLIAIILHYIANALLITVRKI
jgi:hypothetical protein